jgi:hypothetical protein
MLFDQKLDVKVLPAVMDYIFKIAPYGLWTKRFARFHEQEKQNAEAHPVVPG